MTVREMRKVNQSALTKLPWICAHRQEATGKVILIVRGEDGFIQADGLVTDPDKFNRLLGIDAYQAEAMLTGSMWGWGVPGCDPDLYKDGLVPIAGSFTQLQKKGDGATSEPVTPPEYPTYDPAAPQSIADHVVTAFEGGSVSWMDKALPVSDPTRAELWYSDPKFYEGDWEIVVNTNDDEPVTAYIDQEKWDEALNLLHSRHPQHWDDLMAENSDAITSDVLIQLALFGKLVYG